VAPRRFAAFGGLTATARGGAREVSGQGTSKVPRFARVRFSPSARIEQGTNGLSRKKGKSTMTDLAGADEFVRDLQDAV